MLKDVRGCLKTFEHVCRSTERFVCVHGCTEKSLERFGEGLKTFDEVQR
jgi:hypothetical protein